MVLYFYLWLGDRGYKLSLLFDWELREEFNNVQQGMIFVTAQVCLDVDERKMDA